MRTMMMPDGVVAIAGTGIPTSDPGGTRILSQGGSAVAKRGSVSEAQ